MVTRRRFLRVCAVAALGAGLPTLASAGTLRRYSASGTLLGASAEIQLYATDPETARAATSACFAEAQRLERIFSLQHEASALVALNRHGVLAEPPPELVGLLGLAAGFSATTDGAFDITVQPLWDLYRRHFAAPAAGGSGPAADVVAQVRGRVDHRLVRLADDEIRFAQPGMAITLNGIAQGYITDRISELLRARGFHNVLVDMGELRAVGGRPDGSPWQVGLADPRMPWRSAQNVPLMERALATSGGYGTPFDASGRHHHLFDPRTGRSANYYQRVSVLAADATTADALSTAIAVMEPEAVPAVLRAYPGAEAWLLLADGELRRVPA